MYCCRVTANHGALGDQYLREFQDNEKIHPNDSDNITEALPGLMPGTFGTSFCFVR